jgi:hypothetical protein
MVEMAEASDAAQPRITAQGEKHFGDWRSAFASESRHADEVLLARMRGLRDPALFLPLSAARNLAAAVAREKISHGVKLVSADEHEQALEQIEDASLWLLEIAHDIHVGFDEVADCLYDLVVEYCATERKAQTPRAKPKRRKAA